MSEVSNVPRDSLRAEIMRAMWDAYQASGLCQESARGISWNTILENTETNRGAHATYTMAVMEANAVLAILEKHGLLREVHA